ncbi:nucleotide sugar dehydrogenase [Saccharopolyspora flava]|uniref:UDP-N-acetyl-D-glucosamine dehydrogenase n=1 Tax=Saccharopolyspora flava TaxID=95161 RepID=A0A1I6RTP7_9PSEU|nr:nucleotide sugar dehydrogenase [Saccharopolyspora flava]SFS67980.1 UDP-N-acetyl-D-glucosamine dehydrogenase [Saccharopolyspora flava]
MNRTDVVVVGLGLVGLSLAAAVARAGYRVCGVETSPARRAEIERPGARAAGGEDLQPLLESGRLRVQGDGELPSAEVYCLSVPSPCREDGHIDTSWLCAAAVSVGRALRRGSLVLVHSTCPPGTIERQIVKVLSQHSQLVAGIDFHIAHAPDRIDPARQTPAEGVPRVVGGLTPTCTKAAMTFLRSVFGHVHPVDRIETAEFVKTFENTFRLVNIALAHELAEVCHKHDVDPAKVIEAAATKPYGFLPHNPGIGAGGACIPVVAAFFRATGTRRGFLPHIVDAALDVNDTVPGRLVESIREQLGALRLRPLPGSRVLAVGVTYKPDVNDIRNSCAVRVIDALVVAGADVAYYDPFVPELELRDGPALRSLPKPDAAGYDVVVLLTKHSSVNHSVLAEPGTAVLDCSTGTPIVIADGRL